MLVISHFVDEPWGTDVKSLASRLLNAVPAPLGTVKIFVFAI